ncbi:hypothetical protein CDAR_542851 [Caerostris darwini]|uniref:Uncharacterized protein n=1 Tax=Caerostris darwini TaxID=1538125 RepID=A0AAV4SCY9_9ARAC|nr:hypothetical protein CDAR_542851 [Caerostris darwini]
MGLEEKLRQSFPASKSLKLWSVFRKGDGPVTGRFMAPFKALDLGRYQTKFKADTTKDYIGMGDSCVSLSVDYEGSESQVKQLFVRLQSLGLQRLQRMYSN